MYSKVYNYETTAYVVVPQAGLALARLMRDLTGYGSSPKEHFHAIGVVEGAHIVGIAAKHLSSLRMKRISGKTASTFGSHSTPQIRKIIAT